ncbi:protein TonB [Aquamicrobium terrae]
MTMAASYAQKPSPEFGGSDAILWSAAAALVVAAHAAIGWYAYNRAPEPFASEPPASAVMIDLAPMAVAPEAVPLDEADLVDSAQSEAVEETETAEPVPQPEAVEAQKAETEAADTVETEAASQAVAEAPVHDPVVEDVAESVPVDQEEIAEVVPDPVDVPLPEVAMAVPQPRPRPAEPARVKERDPVEKPVVKPVRKPPPAASAQKAAEAAPRAAAPAPGAGAGRSVSPAKWQARVNAHLNRYKRFPTGARAGGIAMVQFTINPTGAVTGASLVQSSGNAALDTAAVALVQRASPIPAPPPEIAKASMRLTVPIQFSRR